MREGLLADRLREATERSRSLVAAKGNADVYTRWRDVRGARVRCGRVRRYEVRVVAG